DLQRDATLSEQVAQFFESARDAFLGGVFAAAERFSYCLEILTLEKAQHEGVTIFLLERIDGVVEFGSDFGPVCVLSMHIFHGDSLFLAGDASGIGAAQIANDET